MGTSKLTLILFKKLPNGKPTSVLATNEKDVTKDPDKIHPSLARKPDSAENGCARINILGNLFQLKLQI